jgi:3-oxoacyl-[acyl-carrier-protein] synthase III
MEQINPRLGAVSYVLGEREHRYQDIEEFSQIAARYQMIEDARLWGWGSFWKSERPAVELSLEAARRTLKVSGISPEDIDALILCATEFPAGIAAHAAYCGRFVRDLGLREDLFLVGVTLNRCTTLLSALSLAHGLVKGGQRRAILVISGDRISSECDRFQKFALFSDGASSCIVAAGDLDGYAILGTASAVDARSMDPDGEISAKLACRVNERLLSQVRIAQADIKVALHNNLFLPIVKMKEHQAGFVSRQLFLENINAKGHCFGSDPLINLADYAAKGLTKRRDHLMLVSSVPGVRFGVLLQRA